MESPAAICSSAWNTLSTEDGCPHAIHSNSDSLSSCASDQPYMQELIDSDIDDDDDKITFETSMYDNEALFDDNECYTIRSLAVNKDSEMTIKPIMPPLEFQDVPESTVTNHKGTDDLAEGLVEQIVCDSTTSKVEKESCARTRCRTPEPLSSMRRPSSRNSLNSRLSLSHNSLSVPTANKVDDSSFITSAMSHDVLDLYNVPLDGDIYTLPVDSLGPFPQRVKRPQRHHRKRRRNTELADVNDLNSEAEMLSTQEGSNAVVLPLPSDSNLMPLNKPNMDCTIESQGHLTAVYNKRHSLPGSSMSGWVGHSHCDEPIHMTLHEVRRFLHNLYSSTSTNRSWRDKHKREVVATVAVGNDNLKTVTSEFLQLNNNNNNNNGNVISSRKSRSSNNSNGNSKNSLAIKIKNRKSKSFNIETNVNSINDKNYKCNGINNNNDNKSDERLKSDRVVLAGSVNNSNKQSQGSCTGKNSFSYTLKQTLCNIFRFRRSDMSTSSRCHHSMTDTVLVLGVASQSENNDIPGERMGNSPPFSKRALPPLPLCNNPDADENRKVYEVNDDVEDFEGEEPSLFCSETDRLVEEEAVVDFASSIEKVKDYGWYWGPISGETAEKVLSNEPDGSFIVRDSSDDHYIFSLTFKLNGVIRHVRIEHDQGNFSFGSCAKFKSRTIVEFIENAVEHSRSGRYLFFLHRRPIHGPMRVQLLHPVSRFKQVQSLQHMCRFVILKVVRRDLISSLPLPRRIINYLNSPYYYSEHPLLPTNDDHYPSSSPSLHLFSFMPPNS